jgi:hypothetical protein
VPDTAGATARAPRTRDPIRTIPAHAFEAIRELEADSAEVGADGRRSLRRTPNGRYALLPFGVLTSFDYETPVADPPGSELSAESLPDQVPPDVRALDETDVLLLGFMIPLEYDRDGEILSFIVTQDQQFCCFGIVPDMNAWVTVTMQGDLRAPYLPNAPIAVKGTLEIGERIEDGWVTSLYRLRARSWQTLEATARELEPLRSTQKPIGK